MRPGTMLAIGYSDSHRSPARCRRNQAGVTLIELVATLVIAITLIALAIPSFSRLISANQLTSSTNTLIAALNLARSEAVKRSQRVTLCKSADGASCTREHNFDQGWIVFIDPNGDLAVENVEQEIVRVYAALPSGVIAVGNANVSDYVSYDADGISKLVDDVTFQAGVISICKESSNNCIAINRVGRPSLEQGCDCPS